MNRTTVALAVSMVLAVLGSCPTAAQERVVALRAAWVIDATGRAPIVDGVVLVLGNRIVDVGTRAAVAIPQGAEVVELTGPDPAARPHRHSLACQQLEHVPVAVRGRPRLAETAGP